MDAKRLVGMIIGLACFGSATSEACTRCVYLGPEGRVLVARSMDWMEDPGTNLYCFPRGMERDGAAGPRSLKWTSKYGSLVGSFYEVASVDGMNEKGLVANTLYLVESDYGADSTRPTLSIAAWTQYVLDNFATVAEAVEALRDEPFTIVAPILPNGSPAQGHLAIVDPSGDSAIFEYVKGKLVVHHGREFQVMTNSPTFDQQLALNEYWKEIGGEAMLPGPVVPPTASSGPRSTSTRSPRPRTRSGRWPPCSGSSATPRSRWGSRRPGGRTSPARSGGPLTT